MRQQKTYLEEITKSAPRFEFYQLLRVLNLHFSDKAYFLQPNHQLGFPATDIASCSLASGRELHIKLNFMGLFGNDSPLPHYFISWLLGDNADAERARKFLLPFNHRIYQLLYAAWAKCKVPIQIEQGEENYLQYLRAISGNSVKLTSKQEFAYCGLLSMRVRNSSNLINILTNYLKTAVRIETLLPEWLPLFDINGLGDGLYLGQNSSVGSRVLDVNNKIRIIIGICDYDLIQPFLLDGSHARHLSNLMQLYLPPVLKCEVIIHIKAERKYLSLGVNGDVGVQLGIYCWLGVPVAGYYQVKLRF